MIIQTQYSSNGNTIDGKAYIGTYGTDPIDELNAITVYTDYLFTNAIDGFGIDLDRDGFAIVDGERVTLYSNINYSIQINDSLNASLWPNARQIEV